MLLDQAMQSRGDPRTYAMLLVGIGFALAAGLVDPGTDCDGGRECMPWLVPLAFALGTVSVAAGAWLLARNHRWGCRVDVAARQLVWWDSRVIQGERCVPIDTIARVAVEPWADGGSRVHFFRHDGSRLDIPSQEVIPCDHEAWARGLAALFPAVRVDIRSQRRRRAA